MSCLSLIFYGILIPDATTDGTRNGTARLGDDLNLGLDIFQKAPIMEGMMSKTNSAKSFRAMATEKLTQRFGRQGLAMLSEDVREHLMLGEAGMMVLAPAGEGYEPAQILIRHCLGYEPEEAGK